MGIFILNISPQCLKVIFIFHSTCSLPVPARWDGHNAGSYSTDGTYRGGRLARERQNERRCQPQDYRSASKFAFLSCCYVWLVGWIENGQHGCLQVNDAVPELVNNTGLTLWAGSTVPIRCERIRLKQTHTNLSKSNIPPGFFFHLRLCIQTDD